jgi:hypothetical protein
MKRKRKAGSPPTLGILRNSEYRKFTNASVPGYRQRVRVKVSNSSGIASHTGPESCVAHREVRHEALTGEPAGQSLSREIAMATAQRAPIYVSLDAWDEVEDMTEALRKMRSHREESDEEEDSWKWWSGRHISFFGLLGSPGGKPTP